MDTSSEPKLIAAMPRIAAMKPMKNHLLFFSLENSAVKKGAVDTMTPTFEAVDQTRATFSMK